MKSLTGPAATQKDARGNAPVVLVEIDWADTYTGYYSEYDLVVGSQSYDGVLLNVAEIVEQLSTPSTGDIFLEFANADACRFSNIFMAYEPEGKEVRVRQYFGGTGAGDVVTLFKGVIESPSRGLTIDDERVRMNVVGYERKFQKTLGDLISQDDFPDAPKSSCGKMMPIIAGDFSDVDVPCIPVAAPADTVLTEECLKDDTHIHVDDTSEFPDPPGFLKIDEETIKYSGKTSTTFTSLARAQNGTYQVAHASGKTVQRVLTGTNPYIYLAAGHECKEIGSIKADGLSISGAVIELANTGLVPGRELALVRFPARPVVEDKSGMSDASAQPAVSGHTGSPPMDYPQNAYDGDMDSCAYVTGSGVAGELMLKYDTTPYQGKIKKKIMTINWDPPSSWTNWDHHRLFSAGQTYDLGMPPLTKYARTWTQIFATPTDDYSNLEWGVEFNIAADWSITMKVYEMSLAVEFESGVQVTLNPTITCRVKGRKDDAAGSFTGTPNALIEYSPDIVKDLLVSYGEASLAADIDSASFGAVKATLSASGYLNAFRLDQQAELLKVVHDLAFQSKSYLWFDAGVAKMKIKPSALGTPDKELRDKEDFVSAKIWRGSTDEVLNKLQARYAQLFYFPPGEEAGEDGGWSVTSEIEDAASRDAYGEKKETYDFHMVRSGEFAESILTQIKDSQKDIPYWLEARTPLKNLELERADVVRVGYPAFGIVKDLAEAKDIAREIGSGQANRPDIVRLLLRLEKLSSLIEGVWGYVRITNASWYFTIKGEIIGRLAADGTFYIKGYVVTDQALPSTAANPVFYDAAREAIGFALSTNARVMEIDKRGNLLLGSFPATDQELEFSGSPDAIECDSSLLWINIGSTRVLQADTGITKITNTVITDCEWETLYG